MRDHQYSSQAIEDAFRDVTGNSSGLFNPLNSDTKVAVTSVTAREVQPCLFTNYNGGPRREDLGYNLIRAAKSADDVTIGEAASCTSAAPWYFKAKSLKHLGTFQDGGLQYNNPLSVALWELKHVWPNRASPDLALSIGTGVRNDSWMIGSQSPVKDRFFARIFRTFMKSMDGEKMWRDFFNSVPERARHRYHRLNITFEDPEPAIDDVAAMETLKKMTEAQICRHPQKTPIINSMLASMFYFEFERLPTWNGTHYLCAGNIFTRTQLPADGRRILLDELTSTSSFFLLRGVPVGCVPRRNKHTPPFKRAVQFQLESLEDTVAITLRGITSEPCTISGLPKCATDIIAAQGLYAPFGRSDHVEQVEHASQRFLKRTRAVLDQ
ncbi:hypothetical protein LTR82_017827 [Friedmanniomyces endolithicus]|uniref:PNPLA domain-containing protein n=1 Tax=Friedmanniomyces endolithicus TaxID=329885 RepID=A0AAN6F798_9PEZI|nr:hypothetical protein LTR82_017827 [Friedmanniomyces endolithicus]